MKETIIFSLFISIFYIVGFGILFYGFKNLKNSTAAKNWPTTKGKIESCSIEENSDSDGTTYKVVADYSYQVNSINYQNNQIAFGYSSSSGEEAHLEIFNKIKKAKLINVRFEPSNPGNSVLSFGFHRSIQLTFAFAITWLAFVFGFTLLFYIFSRSDTTLLDNLTTYQP